MKLAFNLMSLPGNRVYGVGMFLREMCAHAKRELEARDASLKVFHHADCDPSALFNLAPSDRIRLHPVAGVTSRIRRVLWEQFRLPRLLDGADVLYSPNNINPLRLPARTRSVVTIHDLLSFDDVTRFGRVQQAYLRYFTRESALRSARVVTVSDTSAREIRTRLSMPPDRISVISNIVEPPAGIATSGSPIRKSFVIVASVHADKRIDLALRGFQRFAVARPGYSLEILGSDHGALSDLQDLSAQLNLGDSVRFRGYVDDSVKWDTLSSSVALILFGRKEGFGIPVLEAMAVGRPSIVANDGALPEVVGNAGFVVDPEDAEKVAQAMEAAAADIDAFKPAISRRLAHFDPAMQRRNFWDLLSAVAS